MEPLNHNYEESHSSIFLNGKHNHIPNAIEMLTIQPASYTSLRDIIAVHSSAMISKDTPPASPSKNTSSSCWDDVPIKNQLLKQAALAYLQPMSTPPEIHNAAWFDRITPNLIRCLAADAEEVGCVSVLDDVVLGPIRELLVRILKLFSRKEEEHED